MSWDRQMVMALLEVGGSKSAVCTVGNLDEWKKWLSYIPQDIKEKLNEIDNKLTKDLTDEDIKIFNKYKKERHMVELFNIYGTDEISNEDHLKVFDYMCEHDIEKIMVSKLTAVEMVEAKKKINEYKALPEKELEERLDENKKDYKSLSMVDSYVYHIVKKIKSRIDDLKLERDIKNAVEENHKMLSLSSIYASNPFIGN